MFNRNAYIGRNVEILFKNSIGDNPSAIAAIQHHFGIAGRFLGAISTGIHAEKTDVKMEFADGHNVDANVKAFKESSVSYNQLTRMSLANFCRRFSLVNEQPMLERLFISKARDVSGKLFPEAVQNEMRPVFQRIAADMLSWSFSFRQSREIVVVYKRDASLMLLYPMREILRELGTEISFTDRGNISISRSSGNMWSNLVGVNCPHHPVECCFSEKLADILAQAFSAHRDCVKLRPTKGHRDNYP